MAAFVTLGLALAAAATALPSLAHSYKLADIAVGHVWSPPPEPGTDGIPVYGPVLNQGSAPVRLVGVTSPIAATVRFRRSKEGNIRWPDTIEFPSGQPFALAPWREHIWLAGLKRPLSAGDSFDLTLDFGESGTLKVQVVVEPTSGH
jgi:periplasmic copper chaperone A